MGAFFMSAGLTLTDQTVGHLAAPVSTRSVANAWKPPMSTKLSLKEALARRGKTQGVRQNLSDSPGVKLLLTAAGGISLPVELARLLVRHGLSLKKAHDIVDRICAGNNVPVELGGG